jgi:hypothetical protein
MIKIILIIKSNYWGQWVLGVRVRDPKVFPFPLS